MSEDNEHGPTDGPTDRMSVWPDGNQVSDSGSGGSTPTSQESSQEWTQGHGPQDRPWSGEVAGRLDVPQESSAERTEKLTPVPATAGWVQETRNVSPDSGPSTATWSFNGDASQGAASRGFDADADSSAKKRKRLVRSGIGAGIAVGLLALLYLGDILFTGGQVPRGTTVAGVDIGSMDKTSAQRELRQKLGPNLRKPVTLQAGDARVSLDPREAGLSMDWAATVRHAGSQSYNPITRLTSLFTTNEVAPVSHGERQQLDAAVRKAKPALDRDPAEGTIRFEGGKAIPVDPVVGRQVDLDRASDEVLDQWARPGPVRMPVQEQQVSTTPQGVRKALNEVAKPAVSGPVTVRGEGKEATLTPEMVGEALRFEPNGSGGLKSHVDNAAVVGAAEPQLADTTRPGNDAQIALEGGAPVVHPSTEGRGIDWDKSLERLPEVLKQRGDRSVQALYRQEPAQFTTDQANQLGVREVVSEFETGGFEPASGANIKRVAEQVNGALIKPGETFSLNGHTGPRGVPQGYVESEIIENGKPAKEVGGGISQFATTLYNASYFAGMKDVEHKEHSYYISRYPQGREATVYQSSDGKSVIDVKFKNTSASGIMITTEWTPSSLKIKLWGTKQYDVRSETSPQSDQKPPQEKVVPPGEACLPSTGKPGFTVHDTRTIKDLNTGKETREKPSKTVYNPHPNINCPPA